MSFQLYSYSQEPTIRNITLEQAKELRRINHAKRTDIYHEIHGPNHASQFEPDDCWNCGCNIHRCKCKNLGYSISDCLGSNCQKEPTLNRLCSNTNCAMNPWYSGHGKIAIPVSDSTMEAKKE